MASLNPRPAALLIGGDATQQRFCETFLGTVGFAVDVAHSFADGLRALAELEFQLVIVDSATRGIDPGAWRQVMAAKRGPEPLVCIVGDSQPAAAALDHRCDVIARPVRAIDLVRAVEHLRRSQTEDGPR